MGKRVIILTNSSRSAEALVHLFANSSLELVSVVTELPPLSPSPMGLGWALRKSLGHELVNQMNTLRDPRRVREMMNIERVLRNTAELMLEEHLQETGIPTGWPKGIPHHFARSINDTDLVNSIKRSSPDLLVVFGTGILQVPLLSAATSGALNAHTSLLPHYRGSRAEFWQCYRNDRQYVGITIHRIDQGVDTGDILFQAATETSWPTDPYSLRVLNTISVLKHFPQVAHDLLEGRAIGKPQPAIHEHTYRNRDITLEKRLALFGRFSL